jgi:hypothetical protein
MPHLANPNLFLAGRRHLAAVSPGSKPGREQRPLDSGRQKDLLPLFIELLQKVHGRTFYDSII